MISHMISLWLIVGVAGLLGGATNYLASRRGVLIQGKISQRIRDYVKSPEAALHFILQGLVASSLMMGTLILIARESVEAIATDDLRQFALFALCVAAANLGDKFTSPLLKKLTTEVEALEFRTKTLEKAHTEPLKGSSTSLQATEIQVSDGEGVQAENLVIRALEHNKWIFRSEEGLLKSTGLTEAELKPILSKLQTTGRVRSEHSEDGNLRWFLK